MPAAPPADPKRKAQESELKHRKSLYEIVHQNLVRALNAIYHQEISMIVLLAAQLNNDLYLLYA